MILEKGKYKVFGDIAIKLKDGCLIFVDKDSLIEIFKNNKISILHNTRYSKIKNYKKVKIKDYQKKKYEFKEITNIHNLKYLKDLSKSSDFFKIQYLKKLLWEQGYFLGITEADLGYGRADIFGIDKNFKTIEIEVKVSKSDLLRELETIKSIMDGKINKNNKNSKFTKHYNYLKNKIPNNLQRQFIIPNKFIFFIPKEFGNLAKEYLKNTPYGIYIFDFEEKNPKKKIKSIKSVKIIHSNKLHLQEVFRFAKRISNENLTLRINNL